MTCRCYRYLCVRLDIQTNTRSQVDIPHIYYVCLCVFFSENFKELFYHLYLTLPPIAFIYSLLLKQDWSPYWLGKRHVHFNVITPCLFCWNFFFSLFLSYCTEGVRQKCKRGKECVWLWDLKHIKIFKCLSQFVSSLLQYCYPVEIPAWMLCFLLSQAGSLSNPPTNLPQSLRKLISH